MRALAPALPLLACLFAPLQALASTCYAFVEGVPGIRYASLDLAVAPQTVEIRYIAHSTFQIDTAGGVSIATDFFGSHRRDRVPDIATMNGAHSTHYTLSPDPEIDHVLHGWSDGPEPARHMLTVGDVTVRNVTTDIRGGLGGQKDGNSIFVFEVADLCIGHLGHLHHEPTEEQYAALGRMDVLMVPVDGTWTMDVAGMVAVAKRVKASIVLPMHIFGETSLNRFLAGMGDEFEIAFHEEPVLTVSAMDLPPRPEVRVMRPVRLFGRD